MVVVVAMNAKKVLVSSAIGIAAYFLVLRGAFASTVDDDQTGETVDPRTAKEAASRLAAAGGTKTLGARAVEVLARDLGARGNGARGTSGYHRGALIDQINLGVYEDGRSLLGKPWCARAARYAYERAAQELGLPPPFAGIKNTLASVSTWASQFKPWKLDAPKVGAVGLTKKLGHATLVMQVNPDGTYLSVEANHGDAVASVKRKSADMLFYDIEAAARARSERVVGYVLGTDVLVAIGCVA